MDAVLWALLQEGQREDAAPRSPTAAMQLTPSSAFQGDPGGPPGPKGEKVSGGDRGCPPPPPA